MVKVTERHGIAVSLFCVHKIDRCHRHFCQPPAWTKKGKIENDFAGHMISYIQELNDTWCHSEKVYCKKTERS